MTTTCANPGTPIITTSNSISNWIVPNPYTSGYAVVVAMQNFTPAPMLNDGTAIIVLGLKGNSSDVDYMYLYYDGSYTDHKAPPGSKLTSSAAIGYINNNYSAEDEAIGIIYQYDANGCLTSTWKYNYVNVQSPGLTWSPVSAGGPPPTGGGPIVSPPPPPPPGGNSISGMTTREKIILGLCISIVIIGIIIIVIYVIKNKQSQ